MENILTTRWSNDFIRHLPYNETWQFTKYLKQLIIYQGDPVANKIKLYIITSFPLAWIYGILLNTFMLKKVVLSLLLQP